MQRTTGEKSMQIMIAKLEETYTATHTYIIERTILLLVEEEKRELFDTLGKLISFVQ
jgi:hypothetical protein